MLLLALRQACGLTPNIPTNFSVWLSLEFSYWYKGHSDITGTYMAYRLRWIMITLQHFEPQSAFPLASSVLPPWLVTLYSLSGPHGLIQFFLKTGLFHAVIKISNSSPAWSYWRCSSPLLACGLLQVGLGWHLHILHSSEEAHKPLEDNTAARCCFA
jgi:hypothetical protein